MIHMRYSRTVGRNDRFLMTTTLVVIMMMTTALLLFSPHRMVRGEDNISMTNQQQQHSSQQRLASLIQQLKQQASPSSWSSPSRAKSDFSSPQHRNDVDFIFNVTSLGVLKGKRSPSLNFRSFKNIPYAQSPVGSRRWNDPVPISTPLQGVLDATQFGPQCPQNCLLPKGLCAETMSEDCLTLNVYTPDQLGNGSLPVMVFIPGGHFDMGRFWNAIQLVSSLFIIKYQTVFIMIFHKR